ncbi:sugar phosphate nucleotidyltransferase [Conexibacter sp. DBS9H8]|uniref:sugar phosphate nucleotidyltransferase n=1 Tax=Conexibacter sp. DBS9H8 TaxID=2937801 RepID=UPI00200E54E5|nr:NDP-sugar synthase [Conexibacter sp. DBS9H8]
MQALILVGGKGTRLRPLTSLLPKPIVTLVDRPFLTYQLEWVKAHGIDEVILSCGFLPDQLEAVLGDGSALGLTLTYVVEPEPLGTGGALKYAEPHLQDRFFMLNGDTLTDMDLSAQLAQHLRTGARGTLALHPVDDVSSYGLVPLYPDGSVREFLEKPGPDDAVSTNLINAGAYVFEKEILDDLPACGSHFSIERDVFPRLVGNGLYGYEASGYWMDIGTPKRYLEGTFDILNANVATAIGRRLAAHGGCLTEGATVEGRVVRPAIVGAGSHIGPEAIVGGLAVLGENCRIGAGSHITDSVLHDGVRIGARTRINGSILAADVTVGDNCLISRGAVIGAGVQIGDDNEIVNGMRIFPGTEIPAGAIRFSS